MSTPREWIRRIWGSLRRVRRDDDLAEELRLHLELAAEAAQRRGESAAEAARTARMRAGGIPQAMDALRDQRGFPWIDALASDVVFGWRQLNKHRTASAAAILSLGLAIGATMAAFRLVDAVLLRPLPVAEPEQLFVVATTFVESDQRPDYRDDFDYPTYREYARVLGDAADAMVVGMTARQPVMFGRAGESEVALRQFVSGNVFASLGLQPALGRLLTPADDVTPGAHPVAVVSHDYWVRRFGRDPAIIGSTFNAASQQFEIVGVAPQGFTGTEPGNVTDIFVPAAMNVHALNSPGWSWFRMWVRPRPGVSVEQVRQMLQARFRADLEERISRLAPDTPQERIAAYRREEVRLLPAGSGVSNVQKTFRRPLFILAALATLVLLIACANVANLLIAQGVGRGREMALRASLGAARWRLIQLLLVESVLLGTFACAAGALFASWSAPVVVSMLTAAQRPVRLILDADLRTLWSGVLLALAVTALFGVAPALRASSTRPLGALKTREDSFAHRRLTNGLIAAQMAFCVFLLLTAGLFVSTFERLIHRPLGFSHQNVIVLHVESRAPQAPAVWAQVVDHIRQTTGVDAAAFAGWAPLTGNRWRATVRVTGRDAELNPPYFLDVAAGYFHAMRIDIAHGRDFRAGDAQPRIDGQQPVAGVGIVNEAFARSYFGGRSPVGERVSVRQNNDSWAPMEIVGLVRDAAYHNVREPMHPTVYVPVEARNDGALIVRTATDPMAFAAALRGEVSRARPEFRVRAMESLSAIVREHMIRERLLAMLSAFFAIVAVLLTGIGLYGILNHAVAAQQREIGIRMALGARPAHVVKRVASPMFATVCAGALIGAMGGAAFGRLVQALLFEVRPTDPTPLLAAVAVLAAAAAIAAMPPTLRAVKTDPAQTLRSE